MPTQEWEYGGAHEAAVPARRRSSGPGSERALSAPLASSAVQLPDRRARCSGHRRARVGDRRGAQPVAAFNGGAQVSDTGTIVVFEAASAPDLTDRRVWIRDRVRRHHHPDRRGAAARRRESVATGVSWPIRSRVPATLPRTCRSQWSTAVKRPAVQRSRPASCSTPSPRGDRSPLRRCRSTARRSCGRPARRSGATCARPRRPPTSELHRSTPRSRASAGVVTAGDVDVSDDGATVAFVAGPGSIPFAPEPGNVYVWSAPDGSSRSRRSNSLSPTAQGTPGTATSGSPSVSSDGSLLVFDSTSTDLAAVAATAVTAPFVVSVDRTTALHEGARRRRCPPRRVRRRSPRRLRARNRHPDACRRRRVRQVVTSTDRPIDGLDTARPAGRVSISRFGRWVVFDSNDGTSFTDVVDLADGRHGVGRRSPGGLRRLRRATRPRRRPRPQPRPRPHDHDRSRNHRRCAPVVIALPPTSPVGRLPTFQGPSDPVRGGPRAASESIRSSSRWSSSRNR